MRRLVLIGVALMVMGALHANGMMRLREARRWRPRPGPVIRPPRPVRTPQANWAWVKKAKMDVTITGQHAKVTVDEEFFNPNNWQAEGVFLFPLPKNAAIHDMSFWMNGKEYKGEMLDATKARQYYIQTVSRMYDPALLEYADRGLFRLRVFPIPPQGTVRVKFTYSVMMSRDGDLVTFTYPTSTNKYSHGAIDSFVIDIKIKTDEPIRNILCPNFLVDITRKSDKEVRVTFEGRKVKPEKDFVLYIQYSPKSIGFSSFAFNDGTEDGYFVMLITPKYEVKEDEILPKDIVFVVDTSGSMRWDDKMEQAKKALKLCLRKLNKRDRFGLVAFSGEVRKFSEKLLDSTEENINRAIKWIENLEPMGATDINGALLAALAMASEKKAERPFMIIFLTDGEPTAGEDDPAKILENVAKANKVRARVFVFGVGSEVNTKLLDLLAEKNHGLTDYIARTEAIDARVSNFYNKISSPVLSELKLEILGQNKPEFEVYQMYPKNLPDLFRGMQLMVVGRYHGAGVKAVRLSGKLLGSIWEQEYELRFPKHQEEYDFVPRAWATQRIADLLSQIRFKGEKPELKGEVVRLATRFGIVTPYTSYLVLEDTNRRFGRPPGGPIAVPAPALRKLQQRAKDGLAKGAGKEAFKAAKRLSELKNKALTRPAAGFGLDALTKEVEKESGVRITRYIKTVGAKTFYLIGDTWYDALYDPKKFKDKTVKVKFLSDKYLELLTKRPEIAKYLSLGKKVVVVIGGKAYEIVAENKEDKGKKEQMKK